MNCGASRGLRRLSRCKESRPVKGTCLQHNKPDPPRWQALEQFGDEVGIAFSGAEDVAVIEYAHLTGRPFRVFRYANDWIAMVRLETLSGKFHWWADVIIIVWYHYWVALWQCVP